MSLLDKINKSSVPQHIAIIMDGNGRWAQSKGLERVDGHREGVESVKATVEACVDSGVKYLTIYAFSNENWGRPDDEVDALMNLMVYAIKNEEPDMIKNGIRVKSIGDINRLPEKTKQALLECESATSRGEKLTMVLALSYSSKWEILNATRKIVDDVIAGQLDRNLVDETLFSNYLTSKDIPDPDLLIRTGGEKRISNFLLWQSAYSEFYFTDCFWPDFREEELYNAIIDYQNRERRFGKTSEQIQLER